MLTLVRIFPAISDLFVFWAFLRICQIEIVVVAVPVDWVSTTLKSIVMIVIMLMLMQMLMLMPMWKKSASEMQTARWRCSVSTSLEHRKGQTEETLAWGHHRRRMRRRRSSIRLARMLTLLLLLILLPMPMLLGAERRRALPKHGLFGTHHPETALAGILGALQA